MRKVNLRIKGKKTALFLLCFLIITSNLFSQQKSITDTIIPLKGVDVTIQKRECEVLKIKLPLKYLPISVSSTSQKEFEKLGIDNANDALKNMTGVKPVMTYGGFQTFYMRGFGSPVLMLDGQRDERMNYSSSAPIPDLTSIESIELLKGPASVLYGHSAVGGILNIVRKSPNEVANYNASASYGSWNSKRATFGAGGAIAKNLSLRTDIGISDREGWRNNNDKRFSAYAALIFKTADKNNIELRTGFVNDFYGTEAGIPTVNYDVYRNDGSLAVAKNSVPSFISREQRFNDPSDFLKNKNYNVSLKYNHYFSEKFSINNTCSYTFDDINYFSTEKLTYITSSDAIYDTYYEIDGSKKYICLDTLQRTYPLKFSHITSTMQNHLEATWKIETGKIKHNILGGWSLLYLNRTSYTGYNLGSDVYGPGYLAKVSTVNPVLNQGAIISSFSKANPMRDLTNGIYLQDLAEINDKFKILLAGRLDFFRYRKASGTVYTINGNRDYYQSGIDWSKSNSASFTYRAGVVYLPVDKISLYGSFSSFFKPYRDVYNQNYIYVNNKGEVFSPEENGELFKPESGYQAEIGLHCNIIKRMVINSSAFYIHKENIRENVATVTVEENGQQISKKVYAQIGVVNSKGFDFEIKGNPFPKLSLNAGFTFTDAEYGDFKSNPYVDGDNRKGNLQVYTPKYMAFASLFYNITKGTLKNLMFGASCNYSDKSFTNAANTIWLPEYFVADCSVSYTLKNNIRISYFLKNIADKTYYEWALSNSQFIPSQGRNSMVSLSYSF